MEALEAIFSRRSIRKYKPDAVADATLQLVLKSAMVAPSAFDERPWHFVVIQEQSALCAIADKIDHCEMLREAAAGILVCGDKRLERVPGFWEQDCSACSQNILLAAHALGLGAVWLAVYPLADRIESLRAMLGIPEEVTPFALISLGYPNEELGPEERYDSARIHYNNW